VATHVPLHLTRKNVTLLPPTPRGKAHTKQTIIQKTIISLRWWVQFQIYYVVFLDQRHNTQFTNTEFHFLWNIILSVISYTLSSDAGIQCAISFNAYNVLFHLICHHFLVETGGHSHVSLPLDRASPCWTSTCRLWLVKFKQGVLCEVYFVWNVMAHAKRTSTFKSAGESVQSTSGKRGVKWLNCAFLFIALTLTQWSVQRRAWYESCRAVIGWLLRH